MGTSGYVAFEVKLDWFFSDRINAGISGLKMISNVDK